MKGRLQDERGFTIVELLATMAVFAAVSAGLYTSMFSVANGARTAQAVSGVSSEARLSIGRMVRDTREGKRIASVSDDLNSFEVHVDFDGDNVITPLPDTNVLGDFEELTYKFDPEAGDLRLNGEVLARGVECVRNASDDCLSAFSFGSSKLEFDTTPKDGVTTWVELDTAPASAGVGNADGILNQELPLISNVSFALRLRDGSSFDDFFAEAQLRNQR